MASKTSAGNVKHLDTGNFNATVTAYANYIKQFEAIAHDVNSTCRTMVENWKGKGCDAFEKDYMQVQLNLKDISDIMYDLYEGLTGAHAEYMKTDAALSKSYES